MLKEDVTQLMQKLDFPRTAQNELLNTLDFLLQNDDFLNIVNSYNCDEFNINEMVEDTTTLAEGKGICIYTAHMLLFLSMAPILHNRFKQKGISDEIFYDTMRDLRYKLIECSLVHGKYGTMTTKWYERIFEMKIFALGRLQFELNQTWFESKVNGKVYPKGTKVLSVHIPRTGTKLEHSLVLDSYNRAREFFKDQFDGDIIFICNSWLLYPWNRTVLKDDSNLARFFDDYIIVHTGEYANYNEVWRLFDCMYDGNVDNLPNDTSLRRAYIERIKNNQPIGYGIGVII